ncbi:RelA/SpoT domain-containing protein [Vibrio sp. TH_r3]|uniref:RelA/SpoT domain-containing protein n=1 Tax=Vibrio sp. TH_r3 TaxID=3082084 RepID=UPI002955391A|nr:RelA/SpoT domain-containing protein [Vibrio sp. TH_r3]MDV7104322.1 RelA/SpoT domain-containing protein [Vibrio sp. TH_r3]
MNVLLRTILTLLVFSRAPAFASVEPINDTQSQSSQTQNQANTKLFKHSLSGLYGINSFRLSTSQPYSDFNTLYSKAHQAQYELETICKSVALQTHSQALFSGIKSQQRAQTKIKTDLSNDVSKITDVARGTIVTNDIEGLVTTFELLENQTKIVSVKNRFKNPTPSGYRDLNVLVQLPKTKIIAEVQIHLAEIAHVKNGPEHELYENIQHIERNAAASNRALTQLEQAKIKQLRQQSINLYHNAWQPYITTKIKAA